ncbi:MAG: hypothetical protein HQL74_15750 [Magnetococcales bacterium]|nr:hypothetical protein [Magnetococcales bacterium]
MTSPNEEHRRLADLFQSAARQRHLMDSWLNDYEFVSGGGRIWYATDTDVVFLYINPGEMSVARKDGGEDHQGPRAGYAEIFPGDANRDGKSATIALGRALANFIFFHNTGNVPLAVFSPTRGELRRIYLKIISKAAEEQGQVEQELDRLQQIHAHLAEITGSQQLQEELERAVPAVSAILFGLGATGELLRFSDLIARLRLAGIKELANHSEATALGFPVEAFSVPSDLFEQFRFNEIKEQWFMRLKKEYCLRVGVKESDLFQKILNKLDSDAELLAWVQWVNKRLAGSKDRLVLLTGATNLFYVARDAPDWIAPEEGKTFADAYLRHPRAYLAEPQVLFPSAHAGEVDIVQHNQKKKRFLEWLDTFLSHSKGHDPENNRSMLEDAAREALEANDRLLHDFQRRWDEYRRSVMTAHPFNDLAQINRSKDSLNLQKLFQTAHNLDLLRQGIQELVDERIEESWLSCFSMATLAGYSLLFQRVKGTEIPTRNPPPLYFTSLHVARRFIVQFPFFNRFLQARESGGKLQPDDFQKDLDVLRREDPSNYTYFLGFAQLFAMEGAWAVANIQAKRAFDCAERCSNDLISGREAVYMRAVARRHCAKGVKDLIRVRQHLATARQRLEQDLRREENPTKTTRLRFDAEDLAVDVTAHLFRIFLRVEIPPELDVPSMEETENRLAQMVDSLDKFATEDPWVLLHVERNLLANLLMVALLRGKEPQSSITSSDYRVWVQRLGENIDKGNNGDVSVRVTFLIQAILLASRCWTSDVRKIRKESAQELSRLLTDQAISDRFRTVLPYDRARYWFLRDFAG